MHNPNCRDRAGRGLPSNDVVRTDVFEAYPSLSGKENRTSDMDVVFLVVQSDVCGACLDQQDLILLKMLIPGNHASRGNVRCQAQDVPSYSVELP